MENRQPTYPGRVKLTPVPGSVDLYDMERADEPTVEGTPLNKETLLQDSTCEALQIPTSSVPNDAFLRLAFGTENLGYVVKIQFPDGSPAAGIAVTGAQTPAGTPGVTDDTGTVVLASPNSSITISAESPLIDVAAIENVTIESTGFVTNYTVMMEYISGEVPVTSSGIFYHTPAVSSIDVSVVAAGGGGGGPGIYRVTSSNEYYTGGTGGGGGHVTTSRNVPPALDRKITVTVGAGGEGGNATSTTEISTGETGGAGGNTTVTIGNTNISAQGGEGGPGGPNTEDGFQPTTNSNGNGGIGSSSSIEATATDGSAGTEKIFDTENTVGGGGGGGFGGQSSQNPDMIYGANGGSPNGGRGQGLGYPSTPGLQPSGGGGGGGYDRHNTRVMKGAQGGDGMAYFVFHH